MTCAMKLICPCGSSQSREAPTTVACIYSLLLNKNLVFLYFHPGNIFSISILEIFSLHPSWVHIIDISIFSICSQCPCYLNYRAADSVNQGSGQVIQVNEFHLLMKCILKIPARLEIKLRNGRSLESTLIELQARSQDEIEVARMFLSQDKELQRTDMIERGLVLDMLVDKFYLE